MKRLLTSNIAGNVGQPIKSGTLEFLQDAYKELFDVALKAIQGGTITDSVPRVLYGVNNTGAGSNYVISAGAILYNGEVYLVPATSFTAATGAVFVINTAYVTAANADPVTMTDGNTYSVHRVKTIHVVDGNSSTSGYIANFSDLVAFSFDWVTKTMDASDTSQSAIFTTGVYRIKRQGNTLFLSFTATFSGSYSSTINAITIKIPYGYTAAFTQIHVGERHEQTTGVVDAAPIRIQSASSGLITLFNLDNSNFANPTTHPVSFSGTIVIALA